VCEKIVIYHRMTSQDHHEADVLVKQMMKWGLQNMGFTRAILEIGTYNYHGQLWSIGLVNKPFCNFFHHIFYLFGLELELLASI
jgi:hypothetical protein